MPRIKDIPKIDRPREKLEKYGSERLSDSELLAILLRTGSKGVNVVDFIIVSENDTHSFFTEIQNSDSKITHYVSDGIQNSLFDLLETEQPTYTPEIKKIHKVYFYPESRVKTGRFRL